MREPVAESLRGRSSARTGIAIPRAFPDGCCPIHIRSQTVKKTTTISLHLRVRHEYNPTEVTSVDNQTEIQVAVLAVFVAVALGFLFFVGSGGGLDAAIERAIEDGRVILGMTKGDVIRAWGRPSGAEESSLRVMGADEPVTLTWTYEDPHRAVHFSSDGVVVWVESD
jgi:hypothetical protein